MIKSSPQDLIALRLINATLSSSEANSSVPFQCLLKYPDTKIIFSTFCAILEKTRDPAIKVRVSRLFQDFAIQKADDLKDLNDVDEFILNSLLCVFTATPSLCSQKDCETFAKFVKEMLKLIRTMKVPVIFNHFVRSSSFFAPLAIVILTKNHPKLLHSTIRFIIAMLSQNMEILHIAACALFFSQNKYESLPEAAQKEFISENAENVLIQAIQAALTQKMNFRVAAVELAHSLFQFYSPKESNKLLKILLPQFIPQFKETSVLLRTSIVISISDFPQIEDDKALLTTIIPPIASRFDEVDDDFAVAVFAFLKHFSSSPFMKPVIISLINKDYYVPGVVFASYLGYFNNDDIFRNKCFPASPKLPEANAGVMAVNTMGIYKLFTKHNFKIAFDALLTVLTTPELLDDFFIQFRSFKAADSIVPSAKEFSYIISTSLFEFLPKLKGDDVFSHVAPIVEAIYGEEVAALNSADFAQIFVSLMTKYIDDPTTRNLILPFLLLISPNETKSQANTEMLLCDLFDLIVPPSFVDSIRTEAILKSQNSPRAALIALALPNCSPFLPTLSRVVRELYPEDTDLTLQFLINGSKRALDAFLPHLLRFADPVEISNAYFLQILSFKGKKRLHLKQIFQCLTFISKELSPNPSSLNMMLQIAEAALPKDSKIDTVSDDALESFIEMSKIHTDQKWPVSFLKKVFSLSVFAPCFYLLFPHCPTDIELVSTACDSYACYVSKTGQDNNKQFCESCFKCCQTGETLGVVLKAAFKYIESAEDSTILLNFCLVSSQTLRQINEQIPRDMFDSIVALSKFVLSSADRLRILAKDIFVSIYSIKLPVDTDSLLLSSDDSLTPFSVIDYATQLYKLVFEKFSVEDVVDFALYAVNSRPFTFPNALIVYSLVNLQPKILTTTPKKFLIRFFDVAEQAKKEARVLMHTIAQMMAKVEMPIFLQTLLELPKTAFLIEVITEFVINDDYRSSFFETFDKVALGAKLPISVCDQMTYITSNFMQYIPVIVHSDNRITQSLRNVATYMIIWISMLFSGSQNSKLQKETKEMMDCFDELFIKLAKCDHEPIEFSLKTAQTLYQSFGTLVNALLLTDSITIITFCASLFFLLKSQNQSIVLVSALCVSRLFHKLVHFSDKKLLDKLKESVAQSFVNCCDENCRFLAAVMNDIFNRPLFESFTEEESQNILIGTIRGVVYPGQEMKNESLAFLCKITVVFNKSVVETQLDRIWTIINDQDFAPLILTAISALLQIDNNVKHLSGKITVDRLIMASVGETGNIPKNARIVLETLTDSKNIDDILSKLKDILNKTKFDEICSRMIEKVSRSNITEKILELLLSIEAIEDEGTKFKDKLISLLLSVLEDNEHPIRGIASEKLANLLCQ